MLTGGQPFDIASAWSGQGGGRAGYGGEVRLFEVPDAEVDEEDHESFSAGEESDGEVEEEAVDELLTPPSKTIRVRWARHCFRMHREEAGVSVIK